MNNRRLYVRRIRIPCGMEREATGFKGCYTRLSPYLCEWDLECDA